MPNVGQVLTLFARSPYALYECHTPKARAGGGNRCAWRYVIGKTPPRMATVTVDAAARMPGEAGSPPLGPGRGARACPGRGCGYAGAPLLTQQGCLMTARADQFPSLRVLDHPLIQHKLSLMRDKRTPTIQF